MLTRQLDCITAKLSRHVYGSAREIRERSVPDLRLTDERIFSDDEVQCLVANIRDLTFIAFRGTRPDKIQDWISDLKFDLVENQNGPGRIHRGFSESLENVYPEIHKEISRRNPVLLVLTGHSKGAGEATELAGRLGYATSLEIGLVTFGCPRVGDGEFTRWAQSRISARRFVNSVDVVTRHPKLGVKLNWKTFPPSYELQCCYRHFGKLCYLDSNGRLYENPPKLFVLSDRIRARWRHLGKWGTAGIEAHSMNQYQEFACR